MVLLILGDSQIERIWPSVRLDREVLRDAIYFPVKNRGAIMQGFKSITANVSICTNITLVLTYISKLYYSKNIVRQVKKNFPVKMTFNLNHLSI